MASSTKHYGLGYFDLGDQLGTDFAGQIEIDRFVFLDKQIFGLMSIFGNGVIDGWDVVSGGDFVLQIGEGYGNINLTAARTNFPRSLDLIPNSVSYIYAQSIPSIYVNQDIDFISVSIQQNSSGLLLLAKVTTNSIGISEIDSSVRQDISFLQSIQDAIKAHKHKGGTLHPSKIDLQTEVQGKLPSYHLDDLDAQKITTGTFNLAQMPLLKHEDLLNTGLLTHPQLDSFVKTLESDNTELFGEIVTSNVLQMIIVLKLIYDDPGSSSFTSSIVDGNMINEFAIIPGITPNSYIDFDATTAEVDLNKHYIKGIPPTVGSQFYVTYDTDLAWNSAYASENTIVQNDEVSLDYNNEETNIIRLNTFEEATANDQDIASFTKETVLLVDQAKVVSDSASTNVIEGFYSGKFTNQQVFRAQFVREFDTAQDWSTYDSFILYIKCLDQVHGPVKLYFRSSENDNDGNPIESTHYILLDSNNTTSGEKGFDLIHIDLTTVPFNNTIKSFVIYTDDTENDFTFYIDDINIQRAVLLPEQGTITLLYSTSAAVTFQSIEWTATEPTGTSVEVVARASNSISLLNRQSYTDILINSGIINLTGTNLEIVVTLKADDDKLITPILEQLRILVVADSEIDGYSIDTAEEFGRGSAANITINSSPVRAQLTTPIYVDSYYFCLSNKTNQIYENTDGTVGGELNISGRGLPIAPNQVFRTQEKDDRGQNTTTSYLQGPRSVQRQVDRSYAIADTYNDRVVQIDEDGELVDGVGSINYSHADLFPITSSVDLRTKILYIIFSKSILYSSINLSQISIKTSAGQTIQLIQNSDKIAGLTQDQVGASQSQVIPVYLSDENGSLVSSLPSDGVFLQIGDDAITNDTIVTDNVFYQAVKTANGIPVFVGNFAYIDGIFSPTFANRTSDDGWIIANAKLAVKDFDFESESLLQNENVTSVIELNENNQAIFGWDGIDFSPFIPGRIQKTGNSLLLGGVQKGGAFGDETIQILYFRELSANTVERAEQKTKLATMFIEKTGAVILLDTLTSTQSFTYSSPEGMLVSDVDYDVSGDYTVAESSFNKSGRIIKLDAFGNITYSYGEGLYSIINSLDVQQDDSIVIST